MGNACDRKQAGCVQTALDLERCQRLCPGSQGAEACSEPAALRPQILVVLEGALLTCHAGLPSHGSPSPEPLVVLCVILVLQTQMMLISCANTGLY